MISNIFRGFIYFISLLLIQVLVLDNLYFLRVATPFLYIYFILKMPVGIFREAQIFLSFLMGVLIDTFTNTPGMHSTVCTFIGFIRDPLVYLYLGKDAQSGIIPSFKEFGGWKFFKFSLTFICIHHILLFVLESLTLFDPMFLVLRIVASVLATLLLVCTVEALNIGYIKGGEN